MKEFIVNTFEAELYDSSHSNIKKRVLFNGNEFASNITQIAYTKLELGNVVKSHLHQTMEEVFFIVDGTCEFIIDKKIIIANKDSVIRVPANVYHSLRAITECCFYYFGVAI